MTWPATVAELAELERVHEQTIRSEIRSGRLVARKVGGAVRIDEDAYEAWKRASRVKPRAARPGSPVRMRLS